MTVFPNLSQGLDMLNWQEVYAILSYVWLVFVMLSTLTMLLVLCPFTKLHLELIVRNSTTIEQLETNLKYPYDLGPMRNLEQVLGSQACLWMIPCHTASSKPVGDGVR